MSDQDRAVAFYVDTLGFEKRLDAPISDSMRWIEVAPPGAAVSIALNATLNTTDGDESSGSAAQTDTGIRFTVPDADAEHIAMTGAGITVSEVMRWEGVPAMFTVDDPDGNRFYVVEDVGEEWDAES